MLNLKPGKMLEELRWHHEIAQEFQHYSRDRIERLVGPYWRDTITPMTVDPENTQYEYLSLMMPNMVSGLPRVRVTTDQPSYQRQVAKALQYGANRWVKDIRLRETNELLAFDFLFMWSMGLVSTDLRPGMWEFANPHNWPQIYHVPLDRQIWDTMAGSPQTHRFRGHIEVQDKEDLVELAESDDEGGWSLDVLNYLAANEGLERLRPDWDMAVSRDEIVYYVIHVPEATAEAVNALGYDFDEDEVTPENGYWGFTFTIGYGQGFNGEEFADFLKDPEPYWGHQMGPYRMAGAFTVPSSSVFLSPMTAVESQAEQLNDYVRAVNSAGESYKRLLLVDALAGDLEERLNAAVNGETVTVDGLDSNNWADVGFGGIDEQMLRQKMELRDAYGRNSGVSEAIAGRPSGDVTATADQIAANTASQRTEWVVEKFRLFNRDLIEGGLHVIYHDDEIYFPLGEDFVGVRGIVSPEGEMGKVQNPVFIGGDHGFESGMRYSDLGIDVEPYSMRLTSQGQQARQSQQTMEIVVGVFPLIVQYPYVRWEQVLETIGELNNIPGLAELVDIDAARKLAGQMGAGAGVAAPSSIGHPRLGRDIGQAGQSGLWAQFMPGGGGGASQPSPQGGGLNPGRPPLEGNVSGAAIAV